MKSPRRFLAIAVAVTPPLLLAGCQKPNPGVTVWSGTSSEHASAVCWQREGAALTAGECAEDVLASAAAGIGIPVLEVTPGNTVGISVDPVVAESGWSVQIAGQPVVTDVTGTYHRFTFPEQVPTDGSGYTLQVTAQAEPNGIRGRWFYRLVPS